MNKNFKSLVEEVKKLQKDLTDLQTRHGEEMANSNSLKEALIDIETEIGAGLANNFSEDQITSLEKKKSHILNQIERNKMAIPALERRCSEIQEKLTLIKEDRNRLFTDLASAWLKNEIKIYDEAGGKIITCIKRFIACHRLLLQIGLQDTYRKVVGPAFEILPVAKIPIITNFDRTAYLQGSQFHGEKELFETVRKEIVG